LDDDDALSRQKRPSIDPFAVVEEAVLMHESAGYFCRATLDRAFGVANLGRLTFTM